MRRAVGEIVGALGAAVGMGDPDGGDGPPLRRGAALLAVQTVVVVVIIAAFLLVRRWISGADGPLGAALVVLAVLSLLPMAVHWLAGPPRRVIGLPTGLATAGALLAIGVPLLGTDPVWVGLLVVGVPMVVGSAVFGAVSTLEPGTGGDPVPE